MRKFILNPKLVWSVSLWAILISISPSNVFSMPSVSVSALDSVSFRESQINNIMSELYRPETRAHMMMMGISQKELKAKLTQLDDEQLASVAKKADAVKVAGDAGLGILITLLVIGILAIIFVRLANNKKIVA